MTETEKLWIIWTMSEAIKSLSRERKTEKKWMDESKFQLLIIILISTEQKSTKQMPLSIVYLCLDTTLNDIWSWNGQKKTNRKE